MRSLRVAFSQINIGRKNEDGFDRNLLEVFAFAFSAGILHLPNLTKHLLEANIGFLTLTNKRFLSSTKKVRFSSINSGLLKTSLQASKLYISSFSGGYSFKGQYQILLFPFKLLHQTVIELSLLQAFL